MALFRTPLHTPSPYTLLLWTVFGGLAASFTSAIYFLASTFSFTRSIVLNIFGLTTATCGCENIFAWGAHPYLYSALLFISAGIILVMLRIASNIVFSLLHTKKYLHTYSIERKLDIHGTRVLLSKRRGHATELFAFTTGILKPHVYISSALWNQSTPAQRRAVIAHENGHIRKLHVPKKLIIQACISALPMTSALKKTLSSALEITHETLADQYALHTCSQTDLLSPCVNIAQQYNAQTSALIASFSPIEYRMQTLMGLSPKIQVFSTLKLLGISLILFTTAALCLIATALPQKALAASAQEPGVTIACIQAQERAANIIQSKNISNLLERSQTQSRDGAALCTQ